MGTRRAFARSTKAFSTAVSLGKPPADLGKSGCTMVLQSHLKEKIMLDATVWKQDGTGLKVVRYGIYAGVIAEMVQMTFYRHRVTNQLKIIYEDARR
jgi:hypothetical protein